MINVNESNSNSFARIFKGSIIAVVITIMSLIIFSAILTYTDVSENAIPTVVIIISFQK